MRRIPVLIIAGLLAWSPASADLPDATTASPCQASLDLLQETYSGDPRFKVLLDATFANVRQLPSEYPGGNPWLSRGFADLLRFMADWCTFLPTAHGSSDTGLLYIQEFAFLYYRNEHGVRFVQEPPGRDILRAFVEQRGAFLDSPASTGQLATWLGNERIEKEDYDVPDPGAPDGGFDSFNAFFTRSLKDQDRTRPQTMPDRDYVISAPTDCIMNSVPQKITDADTLIPTKLGQALNVRDLLEGSVHADRFVGGTALSCVLMPNTYHHYHAPVGGQVVESRIIEDAFFGHDNWPEWVPRSGNVGYHGTDFSQFDRFQRGYFIVDTGKYGHVALIPVGLTTISSVVFENRFRDIHEPVPVERGDRLGHFAYGGSLFIMIFEPGRYKSDAVQVRLGNQIGTFDTN